MPVPTLALSPAPAPAADADVLLLASVSGPDGPTVLAPEGLEWVAPQLAGLGAKGSADELIRLPGRDGGPRVVAVAGVGNSADVDALRLAAGSALRQLSDVDRVAIGIPAATPEEAAALLEGAGLGAYRYNRYRSEPKTGATSITLHSALDEASVGLDRVRSVVGAVAVVKDLANASPSDVYPESFVEITAARAAELGLGITVLRETELAEGGYGGILGVGQGSERGPRLVRLEYAPADATTTLALVGKGITFDSGGLSLKPMASMAGMKFDMTGAATVFAVIAALAELRVPVRVVGWLCLAENLPSGSALRPNDVIRIRGGKTVEVLNTDAEGRLVMADALAAASAEQPDAIVDVATLTGAQVVALGSRISGLMGDEVLVQRVKSAADATGEAMWPMPLPAHLKPLLKSDVADLTNTKLGTVVPGMLLAGVFLREFVGTRPDSEERIPWAHLDIAGPGDNSGAGWGFTGTGSTGVAVRALIRLAEDLALG